MNILDIKGNQENNVGEKKAVLTIAVLTSVVFGFSFMLTPYLARDSSEPLRWSLFLLGIILFWCVLSLLIFAIAFFQRKTACLKQSFSSHRKFYAICFISNVLIGLFFLIVYFPGTGNYDTIAIMKNGLGMANQHPTLYIIFVLALKKIVFFLGGGFETLYIVNSVITILLVSLAYMEILSFLNRKKTPFFVLVLIALVYTLCPIFSLYKITFLKDVPFSILLVLWVPILYEIWETKGRNLENAKTCIKIGLLLCLSFIRGNGIYISVFILICIVAVAKKMWKRILAFLLVLILASGGVSIFENQLGVKHLFKETMGIPLQQIAATVYYDGEMTTEQAEFIDRILPLEFIKEKYDPYTSVPLKWSGSPIDDDYLYEHKAEFLKVWGGMLPANFKTYVRAYLQATYGFWSLGPALGSYRYTSLYEEAFDEWITTNHIRIKTILPESMQTFLEENVNKIIRVPGEGTCFWVMIILLLALMYFNGWKIFLISSPMLAGALTIFVSTPIAYSWRYILFIPFFIPILMGLLLRPQN